MSDRPLLTLLFTGLFYAVHLAVAVRAVLRPHREPASRIAWVVMIMVLPLVGIIGYILLGETNIGRRRVARLREVESRLPHPRQAPEAAAAGRIAQVPECYAPLFRVGASVNGFAPLGGNRARLLADSNAMIDSLVADIDAAREHVHLLFYIWLPDNNGGKVVAALQRAAARGVACRVMVDAIGSRLLIASPHWQALWEAGVRTATALPVGNPLLRPLRGRIDLRNHRKIVVIDNAITYCGSQNCADPEFRIKAKYAPWVDAVVRIAGPIARQNQHLFIGDWMAQVDEDLVGLLEEPLQKLDPGITALVVGTGPTVRNSAMPEVFETLMYTARHELTITTPYYVPDESMQSALCNCARRGINTTVIFPARNDSRFVGAASRSYYAELLNAGVNIFEYEGGLLHSKTLTLDGEITLIGSANMDRRSFELNYENNTLVYDPVLTSEIRRRQDDYLARSRPVLAAEVSDWTLPRQFWINFAAMLGPVL
ncbi:MAG: cardiolipin synthase [Planctomycetaceae bacterium]